MIDLLADLVEAGRLTHRLVRGQAWLRRRVETVEIVSSDRIRRSVTLDVDTSVIASYMDDSSTGPAPEALIPLGLLPKILLLDFDVRDAHGASIPLVTSDEDSQAAAAAMLASLHDDGFDMDLLTAGLVGHVMGIARQLPSAVDVMSSESRSPAYLDAWHLKPSAFTDREQRTWQEMVGQENFQSLLLQFTTQFMPMIRIPLDRNVQLVKYKYSDTQLPPTATDRGRRIGVYWQGAIRTPAIGVAGREHTRILVPEGLSIEAAILTRQDGVLIPGQIETRDSEFHYQRRVAPDRAIVYTSDVPPADHFIALTVRPRRTGFVRQARLALLASFGLLLSGGLLNATLGLLGEGSPEGAIVLLLVVPSVLLALLAREGEHELVSDLLRFPRLFVATSAGLNLIAGGALALEVRSSVLTAVWLTSAGLIFLCFLFFTQMDRQAKQAEAWVLGNADVVESRPIQVMASVYPPAADGADTATGSAAGDADETREAWQYEALAPRPDVLGSRAPRISGPRRRGQ